MKILDFFSGKRVLTATIFIIITVLVIIIGSWALLLYMLFLILFGVDEYIKLLKLKGINPAREQIFIFSFIFIVAAFFNKTEYFIHIVVFSVITVFISLLFRNRKVTVNDIAATLLGIMYAGLLPVHFMLIRSLPPHDIVYVPWLQVEHGAGLGYLAITMITVIMADIGAYYIGKKYGKTPLLPSISPKKTVEGSIGGTVFGVLMAVVIGYAFNIPLVHSFILGLIIVTMAQLGDLCESQIKRDVGVKDSGDIFPGHGGILDRTDSYILTAPISYYYLKWIVLSDLLL